MPDTPLVLRRATLHLLEQSRGFRRYIGGIAPMILLCAAACASGGASGASGKGELYVVNYRIDDAKLTRYFNVPVEEAWNALRSAFRDLGYKGVPSVDAHERLYMTPTLRITGRLYKGDRNSVYLDCGAMPLGGAAADTYELSFAILVWVVADNPSGSSVKILVSGWAHDRANPSTVVPCVGTGRLEATFMQAIQLRLKNR